jgi:hypothetical protein
VPTGPAEHTAAVDGVSVAPDGGTVELRFTGPPESLAPLSRIDVVAHDDCVQLAPVLRWLEDAQEAPDVRRSATVRLDEALRGRPVLGGAQRLVRPRPGLYYLEAQPWEQAVVTPDGGHLAIYFTGGLEPLHALDHIDVRYRPDRIVVTVFLGTTEDVSSWKAGPGISQVALIELEERVAGRRLVDGFADEA